MDYYNKLNITNNLFNFIYYFIIIIIIFVILYFTYYRITSNFWSKQPIMKTYDLFNIFKKQGTIINSELPKSNIFCDFNNIHFIKFDNFNNNDIENFCNFISNNYLSNNKNQTYEPTKQFISSQMIKYNNLLPYISYYHNNDKNNDILGYITSRPIHLYFNDNNGNKKLDIFYVDYLCVHKDYRNKNIAPKLIQTHLYHLAHLYPSIENRPILFKKENDLTHIIPITYYYTYHYHIDNTLQYNFNRKTNLEFIHITPSIFSNAYYFIIENIPKYKLCVLPNKESLIKLIENKNIIIIACVDNDVNSNISNNIHTLLFFQYNYVSYNNEKVLELIASLFDINSIKNKNIIEIFSKSLIKANTIHNCNYLSIYDIGTNNFIIDKLNNIKKEFVKTKNAYYLYNYREIPINSKDCFIIT